MSEVKFKIPKGMSAENVAETFNAYLLGFVALTNHKKQHGPYRSKENDDREWQLDSSNDYWMTIDIENHTAEIRCRYGVAQKPIIEKAVELFDVRYNSKI